MTDSAPPLVLTLALDADSFAVLDGLRRRHFPPERNLIPAHLTLFHALPGAEEAAVVRELEAVCGREAPLLLNATGLRSLGRGTAYAFEAPRLIALRAELARTWAAWLTPQDRQPLRPHVTIQNKVDPSAAKALQQRLGAEFRPFTARGEGLLLWRYRNGPWEAVRSLPFTGFPAR